MVNLTNDNNPIFHRCRTNWVVCEERSLRARCGNTAGQRLRVAQFGWGRCGRFATTTWARCGTVRDSARKGRCGFRGLWDDEAIRAGQLGLAKTPHDAVAILSTGKVTEVSLDPTLAHRAGTGYDVICWLETRRTRTRRSPVPVVHPRRTSGGIRCNWRPSRSG